MAKVVGKNYALACATSYLGLGQLVRQQPLAATADTALDLTGLPAGVYSLRLASPQGPLVKRLVVE